MILDYFRLAWTSITHRKARSYLTIIGIFIGVAAVVSLIALGQGLNSAINDQLSSIGGDKLIITAKGITGPGGGSASVVTDDDIKEIRRVQGVREAGGLFMRVGHIQFDKKTSVFYVGAVSDDESYSMIMEAYQVKPILGRALRRDDRGKVMLASDYLNKNIFDTKPVPGKSITINGQRFEVLGIVETSDKAGGEDRAVMINYDDYKEIFDRPDEAMMIFAQVRETNRAEKISDDIARALRRSRGVKEGEEDFQVQTPLQLLAGFSAIFNIVQAVLIGIAAISLIVGAVGIMNTMYTSVVERTKEIGIMKSIGATNEQVRNLFLVESGMLGLAGGAVGVLVGVGIGKAVQAVATVSLGVTLIRAEFAWTLIAGALFFSFLLGAIAGVLPAIQASHMRPVDALRFK